MSALSPALATSSGAPWADPLTPLDSALTDCCLSYKQNAPVSLLESALPNASHLLDSAHFETSCFDTLASLSPVTPLDSALTKNTGGGVPQNIRDTLHCRHYVRHVAPLSPVASLDCAYFPSPRGVRVCVATLLPWRVFGDFHDPFAFQWSCSPVRFGFPLRGVFSAGTEPPHARQVQRRRCQGKLRCYFPEPAHPESPHLSLSFKIPMTGSASAFRRRYNARPVIEANLLRMRRGAG